MGPSRDEFEAKAPVPAYPFRPPDGVRLFVILGTQNARKVRVAADDEGVLFCDNIADAQAGAARDGQRRLVSPPSQGSASRRRLDFLLMPDTWQPHALMVSFVPMPL